MTSDILDRKELAAYLKCSIPTIDRRWRDREIPGFKLGRHVRFRKSVIDAWIQGKEAAAQTIAEA